MRGMSLLPCQVKLQSEEVLEGTGVFAGNCVPAWKGR